MGPSLRKPGRCWLQADAASLSAGARRTDEGSEGTEKCQPSAHSSGRERDLLPNET